MGISVVIPVYNEEERIGNCLRSLEKQNEKPDEIILVDNNSTDKTVEIAKKFKVRIVKEAEQGMIYARNRGFNEAKYDIIARCDADAVLPPFWIKRIKSNFQKYKIDALTGPAYFYDLTPKNKKLDFISPTFFTTTRLIRGHDTLFGPNMVLTKRIWKKIKNDICFDDSEVHEDMDLAIHISPHGKIRYDRSLMIGISARRLKYNPASLLVEYPIRWFKTLRNHRGS